jgi:dolichol-phosphate mannosyltransferase
MQQPHTDLQLPADWQVPAFNFTQYKQEKTPYCIIIPVINEGQRIRTQLEGMHKANLGVDIIIVDGGSTDNSLDEAFLRSCGVAALLVKTGPGKLSAQLRDGFAYALSQGYKGMVTIDGNGKDGFNAIPEFIKALEEGYGFVQGSRYIAGGEAVRTPMDREIAVRLIHAPAISLGAWFYYTDTTNGFRAFSSAFLSDPKTQPFRDIFFTYNLHYYLSVRAPRLGYKVKELPVRRVYPEEGKTPTKISGFSGRVNILRETFSAALGLYNP